MSRIRLIHWNAAEATDRIALLRELGHVVDYEAFTPAVIRGLESHLPDAVLIDLGRLPAQGRDVGIMLRHRKRTRPVPLVFAGGEPAKVDRIKQQLPDAVYTSWKSIRRALQRAIAHPPSNPIAPSSALAGYAGTPLPKKLGIKAGSVVALVNAPDDFAATLGALPDGVTLRNGMRGRSDLVIWFAKSSRELTDRIDKLAAKVEAGGMWIAWRKKTSRAATDLTQAEVRRVGLASGLVDYKICAIDDTWSALKFARRRE